MIYDASALLAADLGEAKGRGVRDRLDCDGAAAISAINLGEVLVVLARLGVAIAADDEWPRVESVTESIIRVAAGLYPVARKASPKISLADCVAVATAMKLNTKVVTTDDDFRAFDPRWVDLLR